VIIGKHADHRNERRWHVFGTGMIAACGIVILTRSQSTALVIASLCLAAIGIWGCLGPFWALSTRFLRGTAAAGGIAIVNSIGNLAGFVSSSVIGWALKSTGSVAGGMLVVAASLFCGAILVLCVPRAIDRESPLS
jgi:ACS family tartrate transporter-like MFS transporter